MIAMCVIMPDTRRAGPDARAAGSFLAFTPEDTHHAEARVARLEAARSGAEALDDLVARGMGGRTGRRVASRREARPRLAARAPRWRTGGRRRLRGAKCCAPNAERSCGCETRARSPTMCCWSSSRSSTWRPCALVRGAIVRRPNAWSSGARRWQGRRRELGICTSLSSAGCTFTTRNMSPSPFFVRRDDGGSSLKRSRIRGRVSRAIRSPAVVASTVRPKNDSTTTSQRVVEPTGYICPVPVAVKTPETGDTAAPGRRRPAPIQSRSHRTTRSRARACVYPFLEEKDTSFPRFARVMTALDSRAGQRAKKEAVGRGCDNDDATPNRTELANLLQRVHLTGGTLEPGEDDGQ